MRKTKSMAERFWPKVDKTDSCWNWKACIRKDGYGSIGRGRRGVGPDVAHRIAYELVIGPIPDGLQLDHLCRNRKCVNPAHLEPVTRRTNLLRGDGFVGVNVRKTHCPKGHPYSGDNLIEGFYSGKHMRYCRTCVNARQREMRKRKKEANAPNGDLRKV